MTAEDRIAVSVVKRWLNSKGHRDTILWPLFQTAGCRFRRTASGPHFISGPDAVVLSSVA
ncbi:MAG: CAP domain-containing protein [Thermodesulfovibrionales bacterium]